MKFSYVALSSRTLGTGGYATRASDVEILERANHAHARSLRRFACPRLIEQGTGEQHRPTVPKRCPDLGTRAARLGRLDNDRRERQSRHHRVAEGKAPPRWPRFRPKLRDDGATRGNPLLERQVLRRVDVS